MSGAQIEDIYPLSSLQQIWVKNGRGPRRAEHHKHLGWQYVGVLNHDRLSEAWQTLTDRHAVLRSAFAWEELDEPVQVVYSHTRAAIVFHDLRGLKPELQDEQLAALLRADRDAGFDLTTPPLTRLIVFGITDRLHRVVWSIEGPTVDSWSQPIAIKELFRIYEGLKRRPGLPLPAPPPYRDFIAWRSQCSFEGAEQFWRREMAGFHELTCVADRSAGGVDGDALPEHADQVVAINQAVMMNLEAVARAHRLTLNALTIGAWAIVLARRCRLDFVVFGTTLSGRSPGVQGVEGMVGFFMNILPVPVRLLRDEKFVDLASRLQKLLVGIRQYEHLPATLPASWFRTGTGPFLFDCLFVFENYPVQTPGDRAIPGLDLRETQGVVVSNYPLSVIVSRGWEWLQMLYDVKRIDHKTVSHLLHDFTRTLNSVAEAPERRVGDLYA